MIRRLRWVTAGMWLALSLPAASLHGQTRVGEVAVEIPSAGTEPFGDIAGVVITSAEHAWVVDQLASTIYLLRNSGDLVTARGREGDGPGEFRRPCCVTLAGSRLWVLSPGVRRIDVIPAEDGDDRDAIRISLEAQVVNSFIGHSAPVVLGEGRSFMVIANRHDSNADRRDYRRDRVVALEYDLTGAFLREWPAPSLPDRYVGYGVAEASYPTSRVKRMSLGLPFGPFHADVYSPDGTFVFRGRWPANVDLSKGAMLGDAAWGVKKGEWDEDWLVFLRFGRVESP